MGSDLPKVLHAFEGRPLVVHVVESLRRAGADEIIAVVGYRGDEVERALGPDIRCVWQHEQKGTGHAVMQAEPALGGYYGPVLIACGDVPLICPQTFAAMTSESLKPGVRGVVLGMTPVNPYGYGRLVRDPAGHLERIIEERDATDEERRIAEVNTGTYIFYGRDLFDGLKTITTDNAQGEYYLPDMVGYIRKTGGVVRTLILDDATEGSGVNTPEELRRLEDFRGRTANCTITK
jgi:bifunctional N-acetylglucosamine-1-phosphate-uridyltransferase/glucosamine-1-phosphate-acetyltransferase GlmU-like protein